VRLTSTAIGQYSTWGPQEHWGTYERIRSRELRRVVEIPLLRSRRLLLLPTGSWLRGYNSSHRRRARTPTCNGRLLHPAQVLLVDLILTNGRNYCGFVIILYSNCTGRSPPIPTAGPRQQPPPPMYTLGGSRQPTFQLPATDIPASSTPPMFQAQPSTFDTGDQLAWDEIRYDDILATMEGAPKQADELAASQLTQPPPVLTEPSQLAAGGATPADRATPDAAGSSQAAMATLSPDQLGPRVVRAPDPWTCDRDQTWLTLELLGGRGVGAFRCSTMILYKLFPF
jgi:hypothetical protein